MKSILVTGGCGFIGSNFIRMQRERYPQQTIHNVDKLTYAGNLENLADLIEDANYHFHRVDICNREALLKLVQTVQPEAILNFAAESHVDRSILDSGPFVQTNIIGTQVLMDVAREVGVARYVQVSTDEVYGSLGSDGAFTEETPLAPNSPYSSSKAAADLLVRSYVHTFDFPAIVTRCSNNYGPYQFPEKLIPLFISNAMENKSLPVYGTGENVRDWIHVLDHCRGIDAALRKGEIGEVYNFGGHLELTNLEMTHILIDLLGKSRDLITYVQDRPGHDLRYAIDSSKAEQNLGWFPQVPFEQGIRDTIAWYQSHTDWVTRIQSGEYLQYIEEQYAGRLKK
ncbi:dTDP-glucose 4,6-dehydratase [Polystyrenella longa]|uniref:dTDP-glucose 4,6-dehydratase n=1 Tax=Polystyrenella longa TaxID=2528007 RepID=A0A518CS83_9PLAN|nr:dTDP-glucose 4,6-dehydratase [Polystyrenella longa]QDU82101.1 dTDP-glucose 4,6-dehydratase [Polystyrenella longa]